MPSRSLRYLASRLSRFARRCAVDSKGVAALEFAFIVPIMGIMFIGAVELSQAITVDRRVTQVASSTADLVARWSPGSGAPNGIPQSELTDIMRVGGYIVAPYDQKPLKITIRSVVSSPTSATTTKLAWFCTFNGINNTLVCSCANTTYTLPSNLVSTLDSVVISETTYAYKPLVFDYFMKKGFGSGADGTGAYTLSETIYLKPRSQTVNLLKTDNTPCSSPTF